LFGIIPPTNDQEPLEKKFRCEARERRTGADQWRASTDSITVHGEIGDLTTAVAVIVEDAR
jgi:hypothetical protein